MIIDHIDNAELYYGLGRHLETGLRFLRTADLKVLPLGKNAINGDSLFAMASEYSTKDEDSVKWEAHRRYIDIQYIVRGEEAIGYQHVSKLEVESEYNAENDALFLQGPLPAASRLIVPEGFFAIFFPCDAHRPCLSVHGVRDVRKIVVKVRVN